MIFDAIQEWFQELLIDGIISNLTGMFDTLNTKVGEIAGEVGMTPSAWNSGIFNMVRNLSDLGIDGIKKPFEVSHDPANQKLFEPVCEPVGEKIHKRLP